MELMEAILTRRSIRSFEKREIPKSDLEIIAKAGIYAPSGMNRQTWQITVLTGDKITALASIMAKNLGNDGYDFYKPAALMIMSNERDNRNGEADCACAIQNIFLAAHSIGVGSVWINQLKDLCDVPEIRTMLDGLKIPSSHKVYGMAALGYPADTDRGHTANKNPDRIVFI